MAPAAASAPPVDAVQAPPPIVEPPVLPTPDIGIPTDDGMTIAPTSRPKPPKPPAPARGDSDGGGSRRGLLILAVLIVVAVAGIAGAALLLGGGDDEQGTSAAASTPADTAAQSLDTADLGTSGAPEASSVDSVAATVAPDTAETVETAPDTQGQSSGVETDPVETTPPDTTGTETPALADTPVKPRDRVTIAVSGGTIYVADPLGRVVTLDAGTMRRIELLEDAASPRAIVVGSGSVYIADSESVTRLRPDTLDQQNVEPFEGAVAMASDAGAPIAVVGKVGDPAGGCAS